MVALEQWIEAAEDNGLTLDELLENIAQIDTVAEEKLGPDHPRQLFDRQLDPLTLGQWSLLFGSHRYRFIRTTVLPNRCLVNTIWRGVNENVHPDLTPVVMETAVFHLGEQLDDRLPAPAYTEVHFFETEARVAHDRIVATWAIGVATQTSGAD